ncbi:hypothetical protein Tco_0050701 [Tanacetum coccineum]
MDVVVVDVQIWVVDVQSEVVVMDLKSPMANYPWLRHEVKMKLFDKYSYLKWILRVLDVVKRDFFLGSGEGELVLEELVMVMN